MNAGSTNKGRLVLAQLFKLSLPELIRWSSSSFSSSWLSDVSEQDVDPFGAEEGKGGVGIRTNDSTPSLSTWAIMDLSVHSKTEVKS